MDKIPIIFFGTHDFATTILQGLVNSPLFDIKLVITQPDRPAGRKKELVSPPTKIIAEKYQIPVQQPKSLQSSVLWPSDCRPIWPPHSSKYFKYSSTWYSQRPYVVIAKIPWRLPYSVGFNKWGRKNRSDYNKNGRGLGFWSNTFAKKNKYFTK